jgi:cell division protein FtsW
LSNIITLYQRLKGDKQIWMIATFLLLASILAVYSSIGSMAYRQKGGNTEYFLIEQITYVCLGFGFMWLFYRIDYRKFLQVAPYFLLITLGLLVYTLFFGHEINNAKRWIVIPLINKTMQTSDLAKLALFIYLARTLATKQDVIKDMKAAWVPLFLPITLVCAIIAPNNLSTALIIFSTSLLMLFIGRISMKFIFSLSLVVSIVGAAVFLLGLVFPNQIRTETWISRITNFLKQDDSTFQVVQSKIAIANGGWTGLGPGHSIQKNFLPEAWSDFIYSIICEEYGLIGGIMVMILYIWLLIRCVKIVIRSPKAFGAILAMGLCLDIVINAFANICVSVQLLPATGLTLPLISKGGTSLIMYCISFGIILSVSRIVEGHIDLDKNVSPLKVQQDENTN